MGQYFKYVNLTKKETFDPALLGKARFVPIVSDPLVMAGLSMLLAPNCEGAFETAEGWDIPGRWAGDRIVMAGEYDRSPRSPGCGLYNETEREPDIFEVSASVDGKKTWYDDITHRVLGAVLTESYFREAFLEQAGRSPGNMRRFKELWEKTLPDLPLPAEVNDDFTSGSMEMRDDENQ